jgi:uncharacterized membrane protein YczE
LPNNFRVLFTLGRIFFPTMLHRERELRARMRWVAIIFGVLLIAGVIGLSAYVQSKRPAGPIDDFKAARQKAQQAR